MRTQYLHTHKTQLALIIKESIYLTHPTKIDSYIFAPQLKNSVAGPIRKEIDQEGTMGDGHWKDRN